MSGKYTWKLIVALGALTLAVVNLIPLRNTDFETYVQEHVARSPEWNDVYTKAKALQESGKAKVFYMAVRGVATEENLDLGKFFPDLKLEKALDNNLRKKNSIILDELLRRSKGKLQYGLDLAGGVAFTLEVDQTAMTNQINANPGQNQLSDAIKIIRDRVDALGVAEPVIRPIGEDRIVVQLAGVSTKDNPEIVDTLKKPAVLEFRRVHPYLRPSPDLPPEQRDPNYEEMVYEGESNGKPFVEHLFVKKRADLTGRMVEKATPFPDPTTGNLHIQLQLTSEGKELFGQLTTEVYDDAQKYRQPGRIAIVLDGKVESAPVVQEPITGGTASITGHFTDREAIELANDLNNPLDVPLKVVSVNEIGPTLATDAVISGRNAFILGVAATAVAMIIVYTSAGVLAVIAMCLNVVIIVGFMCSKLVGATLTMPGIAGIVLTIGMAVDSNILIFERMREEAANGKNLRASLEAGFEKAFSAIFDANVTTLITAAIMWWLGTGPVKGFGVTLTIGIFSTMLAALVISRLFLELMVLGAGVKKIKFFSIVPHTKIDFMKHARTAFVVSWTIVLIGVVTVAYKGKDIYGPDFVGGDEVQVSLNQHIPLADIRAAGVQAGLREGDVLPQYQRALGGGQEVLTIQTPFEQAAKVVAKLQELHPDASVESLGVTQIGASVSAEIQRNAFLAIGLSLVGILLYVAFRFEIGYGVGAVVATIHDLLMTVGIFVLFDRQFDAAMVGAILLIAGYSINDTIVVFDRIREELKLNPNTKLRDIINHSLNATLTRTVMTGGTTLLTAISLFIFASGAVNDIAFTLIIGVITGTFSSVFIASPIFYWWHKGDRKHVEAGHDIAPKYEWAASSRAAE